MKYYLPFIASTLAVANGFAFGIFDAFKASPLLSEVSEYKMGDKFSISMDVGEKDQVHMNLNGLTIELLQEGAPKDERVGLPGVDGPHPQTSTGALAIKVHSSPSFIDMYGTQKVRFEKACYEMVWKKVRTKTPFSCVGCRVIVGEINRARLPFLRSQDNLCGSIVCGFNLPMGAKRNGANLPAGSLYLSFPVWQQEGLAIRQAEKFDAETRAKEYAQERDEELQKYATADNLFKKALHYRNAVAAVEKIDFTGIRYLSQVPSNDEVTPIGNGLLLQTKGSVWTKGSGFLVAKHSLLGDAKLAPVVEEPAENILRP